MKVFEMLPFVLPRRPFVLWSVPTHLAGAAAVCAAFAMAAYGVVWWERSQLDRVEAKVVALERTMALPGGSAEQSAPPATFEWPLRQSVDEVIQQANLSAARLCLSIRSLSVSHQAASPAAWGRVSLEVLAGGSYAALKAWQADLAQRFPALAVQNLRVQAAPGSTAGLESQWTWVLYVRD